MRRILNNLWPMFLRRVQLSIELLQQDRKESKLSNQELIENALSLETRKICEIIGQ